MCQRLVVVSTNGYAPGMDVPWLNEEQRRAWVKLVAVVELLPGVLEGQLRRDSGLTHFEYFVLAMLSEAPERTLRMTALADRVNATLPRLSHVISRLEGRGLVQRMPYRRMAAPRTSTSPTRDGPRSWLQRRATSPPCGNTSSTH